MMSTERNAGGARDQMPESRVESIQIRIRDLERRDWWLWGTAGLVTFLLTAAIILLYLNPATRGQTLVSVSERNRVAFGLISLVLLFNLNSIYQQRIIKHLRKKLAEQMIETVKFQAQAERFENLAGLDPLTGLFNRRLVDERLSEELTRSRRHGRPLAIATFDLNDFKQINDRYGHSAGDLVLKEFAHRLRKAIRSSDIAARAGGDEFSVLLPECEPGQVHKMLARLTDLKIEYSDQLISFTCSAGWADYESGETAEQLVRRADEILYINKRKLKNVPFPYSLGHQSV